MKRRLSMLIAGLCLSPAVLAQTVPSDQTVQLADADKWRFSITPYVWAIGVTGSISHNGNAKGTIKLSPGDLLSHLSIAAMVEAEAHKGKYGVFVDAMYAEMGSTRSVVVGRDDLTGKTTMQMSMVTLAPTYTLQNTPSLYLDGLIGARMYWQNAKTTISATQSEASLSSSSNAQVINPIIGLKGRWNLGDSKYFVPFYVDIGGGASSSFTSQAYVGIGRAFDWGDVSLLAKNVYYQFKPNQTNVDINMFGLALAATFRF